MDLETEYFFILYKQVSKRKKLLFEHFGNNFLEEYTKPEERCWYKQVIAPIDEKIVNCANFISGILLFDKNFNKIADVFKDEQFNDWYNKKQIYFLRQSKKNKTIEMNK